MLPTWSSPIVKWNDPYVTWSDSGNDSSGLLPASSTVQERAIDLTTARIERVPVTIRDLWSADLCPNNLLPWLAWAVSVDVWDPTWSEYQKRQAIRDSVGLHRRKGTAGALRQSLAPYDVQVIEWWQDSPKGIPYTFSLIAGPGLTSQDTALVLEICNRVKNVRSQFSFRQRNDGGTFAAAACCTSGGVIAVTQTS